MTDDLEVDLDQLFRLPPGSLIQARDALADRLRKAGDKARAQRVKAVKRATPAAWALNQLHFEEPGLLARARATSDEVRALHAQDGVDPRALSAALISQRAILHEVVDAALKRCETAGLTRSASQQRKLLATLQGVLSGASEQGFGRLTHDLEPGGFDAIATVGSAAAPVSGPAVPKLVPTLIKASRAPDSEHLTRARDLLRERELSAHEAHKRVQQGRAELASAAREQAGAEARVREAEATLASLRERLSLREAACVRLSAIVDEALAEEAQARAALDQARAALVALDTPTS